jgi:hypothetical protein
MGVVGRQVAIEGGPDNRALALERREQGVAICETRCALWTEVRKGFCRKAE